MLLYLSCIAALAGEVIVDAKVPVHLAMDGTVLAEVYAVGVLRMPVDDGAHTLKVTIAGTPTTHEITVGDEPVVVLVGRTGTSIGTLAGVEASQTSQRATVGLQPTAEELAAREENKPMLSEAVRAMATPQVTGPVPVRFRTAGRSRLLVQVDTERYTVQPGVGLDVTLSPGEHILSVRNPDGTQIFARGVLTITGGGELVVQVAEGRIPETSGDGLAFYATSR